MASTPDRDFDLIVLGASGFVGQFVLEEVVRTAQKEKIRYAVSGRNETNLRIALKRTTEEIGINVNDIPIIIVDIDNEESLKAMTGRTRLVLNCIGPYHLTGQKVVRACVQTQTHYLDVSVEINYIEDTHVRFGKEAQKKGVYVISGCGQTVDLWMPYIRRQFNGQINSVETYLSVGPEKTKLKFRESLWKALILRMADDWDLGNSRCRLYKTGEWFAKQFPDPGYPLDRDGTLWPFKTENASGFFSWQKVINEYEMSFINRTLHYRFEECGEEPIEVETYVDVGSRWGHIRATFWYCLFWLMSWFQWSRDLMEQNPCWFSFGRVSRMGPTREQIRNSSVVQTFVVRGWEEKKERKEEENDPPNQVLVMRVKGPDPMFLCSSATLVQCAYTVLKEADKIPENGGAFSPGVAFADTNIYERLQDRGLMVGKIGPQRKDTSLILQ